MASAYPGALDSLATNKANATATPNDHPAHHNDLADAVNLVEQAMPVLNVVSFGATGDGTTDDTAAIQTAVDLAETLAASEGRTASVYFPVGVYITDGTVICDASNVRFCGDGRGSVIKLEAGAYNAGSVGIAPLIVRGTVGTPLTGIIVESLAFDGNKANVTNSGNEFNLEAFDMAFVQASVVDSCWFIDGYSEGIDLDGCADVKITNCHASSAGGSGFHISTDSTRIQVTNCSAFDCGDDRSTKRNGFDTHSTATWTTFSNCQARDCYRGFYIQGPDNKVVGCTSTGGENNELRVAGARTVVSGFHGADTSVGNGVTVEGTGDDSVFNGCMFENANASGLVVLDGADGVAVTGCVSRDNGGDGLNTSADEFVISGCVARSNGGNGIIANASSANGCIVGNTAKSNVTSQLTDNGTGNTVASNEV